jgi:hypothetical protein
MLKKRRHSNEDNWVECPDPGCGLGLAKVTLIHGMPAIQLWCRSCRREHTFILSELAEFAGTIDNIIGKMSELHRQF